MYRKRFAFIFLTILMHTLAGSFLVYQMVQKVLKKENKRKFKYRLHRLKHLSIFLSPKIPKTNLIEKDILKNVKKCKRSIQIINNIAIKEVWNHKEIKRIASLAIDFKEAFSNMPFQKSFEFENHRYIEQKSSEITFIFDGKNKIDTVIKMFFEFFEKVYVSVYIQIISPPPEY